MDGGGGVILTLKSLFSMNFLEKSPKMIQTNKSVDAFNFAFATFPNGDLAVLDSANSMFRVVRSDGSPFFSRYICDDHRNVNSSGIIVSPDGRKIFIYTGNGIMVFDATNKVNFEFLFQIGIRGGELDNFAGRGYMAFDQDGNLVVSDSDNHRIKVIEIRNIDQPALRSFPFPVVKVISHELLESPLAIALSRDACPTLVVVGHQNPSRVRVSSLFLFEYFSGDLSRVLNCEYNPLYSIAITSDGQLAVCNAGTNDIRFFGFCNGDPKIVSETSSCMPKSDKVVPSAGGGIAAMHNPPKKTSLPKGNSLANYAMSRYAIPAGIRDQLSKLCNSDDSSSDSD